MIEKFAMIIIGLIISAVWAILADLISKQRGYTSRLYFWLGFFFWPIGIIVASLQPDLLVDVKDDSFGADIRIAKNARKPILGVVSVWYRDLPVDLVHNQIVVNRNCDHAYLSLQFFNRGEKVINALYLEITCFDDCGDKIMPESIIHFAYQDLAVLPGETFGVERIILLPSPTTRKVDIKMVKMLFGDDTVLRGTNLSEENLEHLSKMILLKRKSPYLQLLVDKYAEKSDAAPAIYEPVKIDEATWACFCGKVNEGTGFCTRCGREKEKVFAIYNSAFLDEKMAELLDAREKYKYYRIEKGLE